MSSSKKEFDQNQSATKSGKQATRLEGEQKEIKAGSTPASTSTRSPERKAQPETSPTKKEDQERNPKELKDQKTDRIAKKKTADGARRSKRLSQQQRATKEEMEDEIGEAEDEAWDQPVYKAPPRRGKR